MHYNNVIEIVEQEIQHITLEKQQRKNRTFNKIADLKIEYLRIVIKVLKSPAKNELMDYFAEWITSCEGFLYKIRNI